MLIRRAILLRPKPASTGSKPPEATTWASSNQREAMRLMTEAVRLAAAHAFGVLGLHRLEANIQPENLRSIALVKRLGFRLEGFSPRYLRIGGEWRDHERWALLAEEV